MQDQVGSGLQALGIDKKDVMVGNSQEVVAGAKRLRPATVNWRGQLWSEDMTSEE